MPAVLPFLPEIIGAAGSIGGALLGKKQSAQEKASQNLANAFGDVGLAAAKRDIPAAESGISKAQGGIDKATADLQPMMSFFRGLLGDRGAALETVSPEVNTVIGQYDTAKKAAAEFGTRGGGSTAIQAEAPFSASKAITDLIFGARSKAAKEVQSGAITEAGFASDYGGLSQSLASLGLGAGSLGTGSAANLGEQSFLRDQARATQMKDIGNGLADIVSSLISRTGKGGGCWIISAVYGQNDLRTKLIWAWMTHPVYGWCYKSAKGRITLRAYMSFGKVLAAVVHRSPKLKSFSKIRLDALIQRILREGLKVQ